MQGHTWACNFTSLKEAITIPAVVRTNRRRGSNPWKAYRVPGAAQ